MKCRRCGTENLEGTLFCTVCGARFNNVVESVNTSEQIVEVNNINQESEQVVKKEKKSHFKVIIIIVFIIILLFGGLVFYIFNKADKLVCKSSIGNITIYSYNDIFLAYKAKNITYDSKAQNELIKSMGINAYAKEFNTWFASNTSGTCKLNGKELIIPEPVPEPSPEPKNEKMVVGDDRVGYVTVPKNWSKFYDVDEVTAFQYSYANIYIVSLDIVDDSYGVTDAEVAASNFMYNSQNDDDAENVTGATVTIGNSKKYTAYQVYMYYPEYDRYLVTYWFNGDDGKVHYIALEGPSDVTDYLYIPESYSYTSY